MNALIAAYPTLPGRLPCLSLGRFPTPIDRFDALAVELGLEPGTLHVKRDDCSGESYGGNKVRKLEFLLGALLARGARRIVTIGAVGSNHVVATGLYARLHGIGVEAIVFPQPPTEAVRRNLLCGAALGISYRFVPRPSAVPAAVAAALARGPRPVALLPPGGSSAIGTLGHVAAAFELAGQIDRGECPAPDVLYVPLGTGGTAAGLLLGLRLAGLATELVAVRVVDRLVASAALAALLARRAARRLAALGVASPPTLRARDLRVEEAFFGPGYGHPTAAGREAIDLAAAHAAIRLEPTYSGKAFAALIADARAGALRGRRALFWLTYNSRDLEPLLAAAPPIDTLPARLRAFMTPG